MHKTPINQTKNEEQTWFEKAVIRLMVWILKQISYWNISAFRAAAMPKSEHLSTNKQSEAMKEELNGQ